MSQPSIAFRYRRRYGDSDEVAARPGDTIVLDERHEYVLGFERPPTPSEQVTLSELGADLVQPNVAMLSFGNFVGTAALLGVRLEVISSKLGDGGASRVLDEISQLASTLVFGWKSPTSLVGVTDRTRNSPIPYHQLQAVREAMLRRRPGARLQDWLDHIARNPTRRFDSHRPLVPVDRVHKLDHQSMRSIFARLDRLATVPAGNMLLATNRLANALTFGNPPKQHFPAVIAAPQTRLSFDTPENRFVRHAVRECVGIIQRFIAHPKLHKSLRNDCASMLSVLEEASGSAHIAEAGTITSLHAPSQALIKAEGYRELLLFWGDLTRHVSLPPTSAEASRMLEGRDLATLYEYWVFLKVLEATAAELGINPTRAPRLVRSDLDERLGYGCAVDLGQNVSVEFNSTFSRTLKTAYSTPLRPDVVLRVNDKLFAFDAKYKLERLSLDDDDLDDAPGYTYKRADLYKMHTYRDAIQDVRCAFVVYPGSEFVFFERGGKACRNVASISQMDGVGAIPLRPADNDPSATLRALIGTVIASA